MQEFITNFHFLRPFWLLSLLVPLLFYWRYYRGLNNKSTWENVCDKKLLNFLLVKGSSSQRRLITILCMTAFIATILAIAGPTWKKQEVPSMAPENPVIILLNLSSEMKEKDLTPSRLDRAKFKIMDLLKGLKSAQTGLIIYTNEPFLISPITDDPEIISNLLPSINYNIMPSNGDRLDRAINLAIEKFKNAGFFHGNIVIFTPDVGQRFDLALEAAKNAKNDKYLVNVIAVSKENNEKLKLISKYGGGIYENLSSDDRDVRRIDDFINQHISELKLSENMQLTWLDMGYYLSIIPVICCLFLFRRGIFIFIFMIGFAGSAQAGWFLNNNQEGYKAFSGNDFEAASQKFEDPNWKASAEYRKGDYKSALKYFSQTKDVTGMYNQGNALAKGGKIEEAIKKYEEVLKLEPEHEDAKFNLEYLKKQQDQQQQQQQNNQSSQSEQNQDQDQSDSDQQDSPNNQGESPQAPNKPQDNQGNNDKPQQDQQSDQNKQDQGQDQDQDQQPQGGQQGSQGQNSDQNGNQDQDQKGNSGSASGGEGEDQNQGQGQDQPNDQNDAGNEKDQSDKDEQEQEGNVGQAQEGEDEGDYDEEKQARVQKFREIPEDPGGLLKAFIAKEYRLNRYGDE